MPLVADREELFKAYEQAKEWDSSAIEPGDILIWKQHGFEPNLETYLVREIVNVENGIEAQLVCLTSSDGDDTPKVSSIYLVWRGKILNASTWRIIGK